MGRNKLNEIENERILGIREIKAWVGMDPQRVSRADTTLKSNDFGGHVTLKKQTEVKSICPSEEYVDKLLQTVGRELGFEYVKQ